MAARLRERVNRHSRFRLQDIAVAVVLLTFAIGLLVAALSASIVNWRSSGGVSIRYDEAAFASNPTVAVFGTIPNPDANATIGQAFDRQELRLTSFKPDESHWQLTFVVNRLMPGERVLEGQFNLLDNEVCPSAAVVRKLALDETPTVEEADNWIFSVEGGAYLIRCDSGLAREEDKRVDVRLPLTGVPQAYPSDHYEGFLSVFLYPADEQLQYLVPLEYDFWVEAGPAMVGTQLMAAEVPVEGGMPGPTGYFFIGIDRDQSIKLFSYAMALIPLAVAILLFHVLFIARSERGEPIQHLLLNVAAAMIAVLPLRQVLVPPEITGLTRIDLLLGMGLVVIIALALIRYVWYIQSQGAGAERTGADA